MSHAASPADLQYGLMAEFANAHDLLHACEAVRKAGYTSIDAFSPSPVEGLAEAIGFRRTGIPLICLIGGIVGGTSGYLLQWFCNAYSYPLNIGGRPYNDIPTDIPVIFELTVLFAGLSAAIGMLFLNGFPQPYHPVFNVERFAQRATTDAFFLVIEKRDPKYDGSATREFLQGLKASGVYDVEA